MAFLSAGAQSSASESSHKHPTVITVVLHDTLQPVSVDILREELQAANEQQPVAILLDLSTPGGTAESAKRMVALIRASAAPVLVDVHEPGTQVAGEGLRLLLAGAGAAMHPETRLVPLRQPKHANAARRRERAAEMLALQEALLADVAKRGLPTEAAGMLLESGESISAAEALQAGLVDAVTRKDEAALRTLRLSPSAADAVEGAYVVALPLTLRQHLLRALMNPDLAVLLLTLGALLAFLEINTPGTIIPGAAGVLLVLLSLYALLQMPLRWEGVVLLMLSAAMLFAETQFPRGSAYAVGAVAALTLGLRLLVRGPIPELQVDWSTSLGAGLGFGGITAALVALGMRARRAKVKIGAEAMLGWLAIAQTALEPAGEVLVRGELWRARLSPGNTFLPAGECVKVQGTDGVTLEVAPMSLNLGAEALSDDTDDLGRHPDLERHPGADPVSTR